MIQLAIVWCSDCRIYRFRAVVSDGRLVQNHVDRLINADRCLHRSWYIEMLRLLRIYGREIEAGISRLTSGLEQNHSAVK